MKKQLEELDNRMYNLNTNLSALVHIQKIKSKEEAEKLMMRINQEIGSWIKEIRSIISSNMDDILQYRDAECVLDEVKQ